MKDNKRIKNYVWEYAVSLMMVFSIIISAFLTFLIYFNNILPFVDFSKNNIKVLMFITVITSFVSLVLILFLYIKWGEDTVDYDKYTFIEKKKLVITNV